MAYFEGNAIYIRGGQHAATASSSASSLIRKSGLLHVQIRSNKFKFNHGINIALGSAIKIDAR